MSLCVLCDRLFRSEQALRQHQQDSPIHTTTTFHCEPCDRFFDSKQALKQHHENAPVHTETYCKACNRTFGSNNALRQHQHDSSVHQRQPPEKASSKVRPASDLDSTLSPYNARVGVRNRNDRRSNQRISSDNTDLDSSRDRPLPTPGNYPRVPTMSVRDSTIKPSQTPTAHDSKRKEETRTSFKFPELHEKIAEAVSPEITSAWFQSNDREESDNEHLTCVVGSFTCNNRACKKRSWTSGVVSTQIRGYARNGYSAVVFNQRCKACDKLGTLAMDETTYVERVAYRIKKWAGFRVESPGYIRNSKGPHEERLCEGCKRGTCPYTAKQDSQLTD
jgi:hypothetical protein